MNDPSTRVVRFLLWVSLGGIGFATLASLRWDDISAIVVAMR
jgi:hypothetical protein